MLNDVRLQGRVQSVQQFVFGQVGHGEQDVELVRVHPAAHSFVVDEQHRRVAAGTETLAFLERDRAVGGGFAEVDTELLGEHADWKKPAHDDWDGMPSS